MTRIRYSIIPLLAGLFLLASCASMGTGAESVDTSTVRVEVVNPNITMTVGDPTRMYVSVVNLTDEALDGLVLLIKPQPSYRLYLSYDGGDIDPIPPRSSWSPPGGVGIRAREAGRVIIIFEVWDDDELLGKDIAYVRIAPDPFYE